MGQLHKKNQNIVQKNERKSFIFLPNSLEFNCLPLKWEYSDFNRCML